MNVQKWVVIVMWKGQECLNQQPDFISGTSVMSVALAPEILPTFPMRKKLVMFFTEIGSIYNGLCY